MDARPPKLAVDAKGYVWRVYPDHWSMAPANPDNEPIPEPVTVYVQVTDEWLFCPGCGRPRVDGPNPGPYCLPTNCEMWEVVS